ncbi:hypothetical protein FRB99_001413 [Tulasnella sp. 403]|nr:hypothetical protein FRB99_001413 [Tulasnella sp. 403]
MKPSAVCISILFALLPFSSAKLAIKSGKASVAGSDGSIDTTSAIDTSKGSQSLKLNAQDTLKLSFTVYDDADNVDVQPHQTFLRFWDASIEEEGIVPVKVSRDGKAKFTMNLRKPPVGLPPSSTNPLQVTLLLGSFTRESAAYPLFDLTLPPSGKVPPHPEEETFHPQPEIAHTFRPEQKSPLKFISLVFAIATLSPWVVLLGLGIGLHALLT